MAHRPLRHVALPSDVGRAYDNWLADVEARLANPACDRNRLCRDVLFELYYPGAEGTYDEALRSLDGRPGRRAALLALDPKNVTLEPEYYDEIDLDQYDRVKPLLWLWQCFDRSPLGGGNVDVAVRFRRVLAKHIFRRCGRNFKCFQFVEFSFGYNMQVGDDVVVHRHVLLDDRGGIRLGNRVSIADYANVYSHTHDITDQADVTDAQTVLEDGVRVTYHATLLAGVHAGRDSMIGAMALVTRPVPPYQLHLGIPAKLAKVKPNAPPEYRERPAP